MVAAQDIIHKNYINFHQQAAAEAQSSAGTVNDQH